MSHAGEGRTREAPLDLTADSDDDDPTRVLGKLARTKRKATEVDRSQPRRLGFESRVMGAMASRPGINASEHRSSAGGLEFLTARDRNSSDLPASPLRWQNSQPGTSRHAMIDLTFDDDEPLKKTAKAIERRSASAKRIASKDHAGSESARDLRASEPGSAVSKKRPLDEGDAAQQSSRKRQAGEIISQPNALLTMLQHNKRPAETSASDMARGGPSEARHSDAGRSIASDSYSLARTREGSYLPDLVHEPQSNQKTSAACMYEHVVSFVTQPQEYAYHQSTHSIDSANGTRQDSKTALSRRPSEDRPDERASSKRVSPLRTSRQMDENRDKDDASKSPRLQLQERTDPGHSRTILRQFDPNQSDFNSNNVAENLQQRKLQADGQHEDASSPTIHSHLGQGHSRERRSTRNDDCAGPSSKEKSGSISPSGHKPHCYNNLSSSSMMQPASSSIPQPALRSASASPRQWSNASTEPVYQLQIAMHETHRASKGPLPHESQRISIEKDFAALESDNSIVEHGAKYLKQRENEHVEGNIVGHEEVGREIPQLSIESDDDSYGARVDSAYTPRSLETESQPMLNENEKRTRTYDKIRAASETAQARTCHSLGVYSLNAERGVESSKLNEEKKETGTTGLVQTRYGKIVHDTTPVIRPGKEIAMTTRSHSSDVVCIDSAIQDHLAECRNDYDYWHVAWVKKARERAMAAQNPTRYDKPTSVFKNMKPMQSVSTRKPSNDEELAILRIETFEQGRSFKSEFAVRCDTIRTFDVQDEDVPKYIHYVSLKNNFLAENETILQHWPYFGDDVDLEDCTNLRELYFLDIVDRQRKLECMLKAESVADYVDSILVKIRCEWVDVLRFLLDPHPAVGPDPSASQALRDRDQFCSEDFLRHGDVSLKILRALPQCEPAAVGRAAVFCQRFHEVTTLQPWHLARRCDLVRNLLAEKDDQETSTCRICLRYHCLYHGEMNETPNGDSTMPIEAAHDVDETDIINVRKVNFRHRVACPPSVASTDVVMPRKERTDWSKGDYNMKHEDRGPYYPCHHPGVSCDDARCVCWSTKTPCEKMCSCPSDCKRRWQGCSCRAEKAKKGQKLVCFEDARCICYQNSRECDADLCGDCGVRDVLDPINRYDENVQIGRCHNASIQRGVPKRTLIGTSGVHGFGLYTGDHVREHEFVGEYRGEVITKEEAERRGAVNEHQKLSYLFSLNKTQEIDSTYFGNKVRFINHAHESKANLYPRIVFVNTQHRIGLYSRRKIKPGEELFFDYGPQFPDTQLGGNKTSKKSAPQKANKSIPHVRNAGLTRDFIDVEYENDALGNRRAVKVGQSGKRHGVKGRGRGRLPDEEEDDLESVNEDVETANILETELHPDVEQRLDYYLSNENDHIGVDDEDAFDDFQPEDESDFSSEDNDLMQEDSED